LLKLSDHTLVVRLDDIIGNTFHAEDFNIKTRAIWKRIVNGGKLFLVHLAHMHRQASCGVEPPATSVAFKMLRFLMRYKDFEIVKITLTVITPRPSQKLFE
jgi:hypothetical protein